MRKMVVLVGLAAIVACSGDREYESAGTVDTTADTTARVSIPDIDVGMTRDTLSLPTFGTQKDTIIVDKPVVTGRRPVEVKRPTVDADKKP